MIVIVDYGMGNLRSVSKALESLGASVRVSSDPRDVAQAQKLILPGVGAFPAAMRELSSRTLVEPIKTAISNGVPYLGICLGLQLLFESSDEGEQTTGLGVLKGRVTRLAVKPPLKIPHMGWNQVASTQHTAHSTQQQCPLLKGIPEKSFFYFVHSYAAKPADRSIITLEAEYGEPVTAMVWQRNLFATQFHPEKSQTLGLKLLQNFINL
ncbi:MAG: imidazole glycerol phosphate synthase subunit HisH [Candidatus Omnitrophica bacterium]|nr:imidazole glycerol phosphate synthase subunit HisH [Candidatus Omnitrophota bacterium]